jgi:BirA family biotin operon repressor/biotin-[acetyl-CoA-carboxylase] ligase
MNSFQIDELPLATRVIKPQVIHFGTLDSTNAYLLGRHPHPSGTVVWADFQSAGRGRLGRAWISPPDQALLFSFYLKIFGETPPLFIYPFLSAVGVLEALKTVVPPAWLALKWPNDVLLKNKKICGILVQSKTRNKKTDIVIGIGLNLNQNAEFFQPDLPFAGSLFSITGQKYERLPVLTGLIAALDRNLADLERSGAPAILQKWREHCPYLGSEIKVDDGRQIYSGVFTEITETGGLILHSGREKRVFHAGDVTIVKEL